MSDELEARALTREQVERMLPLTNMDAKTVHLGAGQGHVGVYTALLLLIDHDAVMRKALREERRRVWEEAEKMLLYDDVLLMGDELDGHCKIRCFEILGRLADKCRQQAKEEGL